MRHDVHGTSQPRTAPRSTPPGKPADGLSHAQRSQRIRDVVTAAGEDLRQRHGWLRHQDAIGFTIQFGSVALMLLCAWAYVADVLPWWAVIPLVAVLASFTHEMEHDLIHKMYFKQQPWMQDLMLLVGWLARPTTVNPWIRRDMHFHHHKHSGQANDFEERAITNGEPWGVKRFLMTADTYLSFLLRRRTMRGVMKQYVKEVHKPQTKLQFRIGMLQKIGSLAPIGLMCWSGWHVFLYFHAVDLGARALGMPLDWPQWLLAGMDILNVWVVCLIAPNVLRNFSLHFISSNMHFYGNVQKGNVLQQCQVLNHPLFWPFQLFCFNFGSTHAIHHFVVGQPFYIRQMVAKQAHAVMRDMGVVFNDLGTFRRANRLPEGAAA